MTTGVLDNTTNSCVLVVPVDTFTPSSFFLHYLCNKTDLMHHECCQEAPVNIVSLGITRLRVLMIPSETYLVPCGFQ